MQDAIHVGAAADAASSVGPYINATTTTTTYVTSTTVAVISSPPMRCNGFSELCDRSYGNVTMIGAHNSPFVGGDDVASNQLLPVEDQLDDGVRFIQGQIHIRDGEPHFCHTSCLILDVGPIINWFRRVKAWLDVNPNEVVTILLGNGDESHVDTLVPRIESTGIVDYAYVPWHRNISRSEWPTLAEMITANKRAVIFLDYYANETRYPWLLNEFAYMWETPMDPLSHRDLPCTVQRPRNMPEDKAHDRLYIMNHNINNNRSLFGVKFTVPAVDLVVQSNAASGEGSLGNQSSYCQTVWGQPPTVLNTDFYNYGPYPGSVFEALAKVNGVGEYKRGDCCGKHAEERKAKEREARLKIKAAKGNGVSPLPVPLFILVVSFIAALLSLIIGRM